MTISEAITVYVEQHAIENDAKKKADAARKFILSYVGDRDEIRTDEYTVYIKRTVKNSLDTVALYHDFPDIKETYGKQTVSATIDAHRASAAPEKTA